MTNRRGFFAALGAAFAAARFAKAVVPGKYDVLVSVGQWHAPRVAKVGDTIFVRKPQRFVARDGFVLEPFCDEYSMHVLTPGGLVPPRKG